MNRRVFDHNKRRKTLTSMRSGPLRNRKLKDYTHDDLMGNNEMLRTLARRHALEKIEGIYPRGDVEKSVASMTIRMPPSELASFARSIQKELGQPARPTLR